jgi:hypothetical protein
LVAVLADVLDTQIDKHGDVVRGEGLGDNDQLDRSSRAAGRSFRRSEAFARRCQAGCDLASSLIGDHPLLQEVGDVQVVG